MPSRNLSIRTLRHYHDVGLPTTIAVELRSVPADPRTRDVPYGALGAYVTSHAIGVEGPVREAYLVGLRTPTAGWHTEIGWPVFGVR